MIKRKCFFDFSKEEQWLTEMAQKGFAVVHVNSFGKYTFQAIKPATLNYKIDYRVFKNMGDFTDYYTLFEDSGWRHFSGTKSSGLQYFVQVSKNASTDIFSDTASRAGRYKRLSSMWLSLAVCYFPIVIALMTTNFHARIISNPKELYLTPGLWSMSGVRFWRAFLFETPFALGRGFSWAFVLIALLLYLYFFCRYFFLYRSSSKKRSV